MVFLTPNPVPWLWNVQKCTGRHCTTPPKSPVWRRSLHCGIKGRENEVVVGVRVSHGCSYQLSSKFGKNKLNKSITASTSQIAFLDIVRRFFHRLYCNQCIKNLNQFNLVNYQRKRSAITKIEISFFYIIKQSLLMNLNIHEKNQQKNCYSWQSIMQNPVCLLFRDLKLESVIVSNSFLSSYYYCQAIFGLKKPSKVQRKFSHGPWPDPTLAWLLLTAAFDPGTFCFDLKGKIEKFDIFRGNFPNPNPNHKWLTRPGSKKFYPDPSLREMIPLPVLIEVPSACSCSFQPIVSKAILFQ